MNALDPITRLDFQRLSENRCSEATALFAAQQFEGVYYLIGYVVECALKACLCHRHPPDHFPPESAFSRNWIAKAFPSLPRSGAIRPPTVIGNS